MYLNDKIRYIYELVNGHMKKKKKTGEETFCANHHDDVKLRLLVPTSLIPSLIKFIPLRTTEENFQVGLRFSN